jgi:hypothetical protein
VVAVDVKASHLTDMVMLIMVVVEDLLTLVVQLEHLRVDLPILVEVEVEEHKLLHQVLQLTVDREL